MSTSQEQIEEMRERGYITVAAAAVALHKSKWTLQRRIKEGTLETEHMGQLFIAVDSLIAYYGGASPRARALVIEQLGAVQRSADANIVVWWCPATPATEDVSPAPQVARAVPLALGKAPRRRAR
jgi:hypothetical protein